MWRSKLSLSLIAAVLLAATLYLGRPTVTPAVRHDRCGDSLPAGALARLGSLRLRQPASIRLLTFSGDGRSLISVPDFQAADSVSGPHLFLWDVLTGRLIRQFGHEGQWVGHLSLNPPPNRLLTTEFQGVFLWDIESGRLVRQLSGKEAEGGITHASFLPGGKSVIGVGDHAIETLAMAEGRRLSRVAWSGRDEIVLLKDLAFSPDGKTLIATEQLGRRMMLWDTATGKLLGRYTADTGSAVAFAPAALVFAVGGGKEGTVQIRDTQTGRLLRQWRLREKHLGMAWDRPSLAFSPDGKLLAGDGGGESIGLWDWATGRLARKFEGPSLPLTLLAFSPDGKLLAGGGGNGKIRLWQASDGKQLLNCGGHEWPIDSLAYLKDGTLFSAALGGSTCVWDASSGRELRTLRKNETRAASSPDGKVIAFAGANGTILLTDAVRDRELRLLKGLPAPATSLVFSPDGGVLAAAAKGGIITLYRVVTGEQIGRLGNASLRGSIETLAFSPDGMFLASGGSDRAVGLWNLGNKKLCRQLMGSEMWVNSVAFTPNGRAVIAGSADGSVRSWEVSSGRQSLRLEPNPNGATQITCVACSPDGRLIASGEDDMPGGTVRIWETVSGREVCRFPAQAEKIRAVSFSPDGRTVASGGEDSTILIWDVSVRLAGGGKFGGLGHRSAPQTLTTEHGPGNAYRCLAGKLYPEQSR